MYITNIKYFLLKMISWFANIVVVWFNNVSKLLICGG